jgi:SAM-dependent methyltransferase
MDSPALLARVRARPWFYEFDLPDGSVTTTYLPPGVAAIHTTRLAMLWRALARHAFDGLRVVDIACHQGYFATHLARKGCREVVAIDARAEHVADVALIAQAYGLHNVRTMQADINTLDPKPLGTFDVTLMLGLLYHVENPVGVLRLARALTRGVCVIETQVTPNMSGVVDWGSYRFQRPMVGSLAIIDETAETHAPEASTTGICLCPSLEALVWLLGKVGFARVERIAPPEDAYEQHASGKRVMVAAYTRMGSDPVQMS